MATDPRCPACGEPVGSGALGCVHCGAQFAEPAGDTGWDEPTDRAGEGTGGRGDDAGTHGRERAGSGDGREQDAGLRDRLLDPEGTVDDGLTVAVAGVVAVVCAFVSLMVFGTVAGGGVGLLAALVTLVGLFAWLGRQYSVFGAVRGGCYALAAALVCLPLVALTDAAEGGTFGGQVLLFLVAELLFGVVAAVLVGIGYSAGKRRPDPEDDEAGAGTTGTRAAAGTGSEDGAEDDGGGEGGPLGSVVRRE